MIKGVPYYLKQQIANKKVSITGTLVKHNTTIAVETIKLKKNGKTLTVWSEEMKSNTKRKMDWIQKYEHDRQFYGN